jgi:acetoacetate decarboxylase
MVLQGNSEGFSPPFDSSLFGASVGLGTPGTDYEIEYSGCEAIGAFFTTSPDVRALLPEGVEPYSDPPSAGVLLAHYPHSTVGVYHEYLSVIQVADVDGNMAYYIPYIYVTNDAALAAGRELAGAPKKIADMALERDGSVYRATMDRPEDTRLVTMTTTPETRATGSMIDTILPEKTPLLSVRHLPPIEGGDGCTQLVKWYATIDFHTDEDDVPKRWLGPTDLRYEAESPIDPVHNLAVEDLMAGMYINFDMKLGVTEVQKEWEL